MDRRLRIMAIAGAAAASALILLSPSAPIPLPPPIPQDTEGRPVEVLATNLDKPRSIAGSGDRIFITEKDGRIRVVEGGALLERPLATLRAADVFDGGLLGIDTHPNFGENHRLYVYLTYVDDGNLWNRIIAITESENVLVSAETILDGIPGSPFSNGGALKFGPDGKLYAATGSVSDTLHLSQDPDSLAGKILRMNDDGTVPGDNPVSGSLVYASGLRNPQGMTWGASGGMIVSDLGPEKNDEINLVNPGDNFGWPEQECGGAPGFAESAVCYDPAIEPGGIAHYSGERLDLDGDLLVASLRAISLFEIDVEGGLDSQKSVLVGLGRVRDVYVDTDGILYVITSNTDGKGFPDRDDDRLVRISR